MKTGLMKKTLFTTIIILLLVVCMACGDVDTRSGEKDPAKGEKPTEAATQAPDKDDDKKDDHQDDGKKDDGKHAETYDNYYYLINYYEDGTLHGYIEDGQFVFWPGLWVSFGDGYVQYNWQFIDQNAYSSCPDDAPSGTTFITVYSAGGQEDWGSYVVTYSNDIVRLREAASDSGEYIFVNSKLIDFSGDICAQIKAITGLDVKLPVEE